MNVGRYCNRDVVFIYRNATLPDAARLMRQHHVGDLVVVEEQVAGRLPVGILTDRDIVIETLAQDVDPSTVAVGDIMSFRLATAHEDDDLFDTIAHMRARGIRRLPVVNRDNVLVGILSVDDLIELFAEQLSELAKLIMREQRQEREKRG